MTLVTNENRADVSEARQTFNEFQPAYNVEEGEPLHDLLQTIIKELQRIDLDIDQLYDQRFLSTATGEELERLGDIVDIDRKTGEGDNKLRQRIRGGFAVAVSKGTYDDIARVGHLVLDADPSDINIVTAEEVYDKTGDPATVLIESDQSVIDSSALSSTEMETILTDAVVGGHRITIQPRDVFTWDVSGLGWGTIWGDPEFA